MCQYTLRSGALLVTCLVGVAAVAQPPAPRVTGVKKLTEPVSRNPRKGVVEKIDADGLTLVEKRNDNVTVTHQLAPIDVLRNGGVLDPEGGPAAYRWTDVKKGDVVTLYMLKDEGDGLTYCLQISILRRPGGKLPEGQDPERDRMYPWRRLYNDIENGEDVSDEEILKVSPPKVNRFTGEFFPGGLPTKGYDAKYREMLDANRKRIAEEKAKKEKEAALKAKPADKTDPKKDDKK